MDGGRPLFMRRPDAKLTLANFARAQLYSAMATLKLGMDILFDKENVKVDTLLGHGGLFKTPVVGQRLLAGALNVPVAVMETAGEGGPWGMAVLAAYRVNKEENETLESYLENKVFGGAKKTIEQPVEADVQGLRQVHRGLPERPRGGEGGRRGLPMSRLSLHAMAPRGS